ncbi:hypothetical protein JOM56_015704 [Amanita muscaria]
MISEVEPDRVFCSLCQKWVQLRQDSSSCAYPWLQHRGKYLTRHTSGKPAVGGIQQTHTITVDNPISEANYYRTLDENTNRPNVYNEGIAQGIVSESDLAAANYHTPLYRVGNSHGTLTGTYNPELQTRPRNNVQPSCKSLNTDH